MLGCFQRIFRDGAKSSAARWAAGSLALVSAFGTLTSLVLWIELGAIGGAIGFATTTGARITRQTFGSYTCVDASSSPAARVM